MSLTSILSYSNKQYKDFRTFLEDLFPTPKLENNDSIKVEPITKNYALIGIAFDYLLRFSLEKKFKEFTHSDTWVAEKAMSCFFDNSIITSEDPFDMDINDMEQLINKKSEESQPIITKYERCKKICQEYINTSSDIGDGLLEASLFLSRLDLIYRAGPNKTEINLDPESADDLKDLRLLLHNCSLDLFRPKEKIILNPTFGVGSIIVGGADGDLM